MEKVSEQKPLIGEAWAKLTETMLKKVLLL